MSVNEIARAEVRRLIVESAEWITEQGRPRFSRADIVGAMPRGVSPMVLAYELEGLRLSDKIRRIRESSGPRPALYALPRVADAIESADGLIAPDFKPGFPSTGEKIGPAWAAMWGAMADGDWHDAFELAAVGAGLGGVLPGSARNLLFPAAQAGLVEPEARYDEAAKRWRTWYRRAA